jgi:hypothetical protein
VAAGERRLVRGWHSHASTRLDHEVHVLHARRAERGVEPLVDDAQAGGRVDGEQRGAHRAHSTFVSREEVLSRQVGPRLLIGEQQAAAVGGRRIDVEKGGWIVGVGVV